MGKLPQQVCADRATTTKRLVDGDGGPFELTGVAVPGINDTVLDARLVLDPEKWIGAGWSFRALGRSA